MLGIWVKVISVNQPERLNICSRFDMELLRLAMFFNVGNTSQIGSCWSMTDVLDICKCLVFIIINGVQAPLN